MTVILVPLLITFDKHFQLGKAWQSFAWNYIQPKKTHDISNLQTPLLQIINLTALTFLTIQNIVK